MSQVKQILKHLQTYRFITAEYAQKMMGIRGFTARISDLRSSGYPILEVDHDGRALKYMLPGYENRPAPPKPPVDLIAWNSLDIYQREAGRTKEYDNGFFPYASLMVKAGNIADQARKPLMADESMNIDRKAVAKAVGESLWYLAQICDQNGIKLSEIASRNLIENQTRRLELENAKTA